MKEVVVIYGDIFEGWGVYRSVDLVSNRLVVVVEVF